MQHRQGVLSYLSGSTEIHTSKGDAPCLKTFDSLLVPPQSYFSQPSSCHQSLCPDMGGNDSFSKKCMTGHVGCSASQCTNKAGDPINITSHFHSNDLRLRTTSDGIFSEPFPPQSVHFCIRVVQDSFNVIICPARVCCTLGSSKNYSCIRRIPTSNRVCSATLMKSCGDIAL